MLDRFIWGEVSRISPEAPVPVVKVVRESEMPGGAANVVANLSSLGGNCFLVGVVGNDAFGEKLCEKLKKTHVNIDGIIKDPSRETTVKTRIVAHGQQVVRVDREQLHDLNAAHSDESFDFIKKIIDKIDIIIIEDYGKGVINKRLLRNVIELAHEKKKMVTVDPKEDHFALYKGVTAITPNHHEAGRALGRKVLNNDEDITEAGKELLDKFSCEAVLVTRGEKGMSVFEKKGDVTHIPTIAREVYDVSGAGDTVIATFSLALAAGAEMKKSAYLSNIAGGIVVGKVGVATISPKELEEKLCTQLE